jgi:twinkle protein
MITVQEWLEERGLDSELADKMGWGSFRHPKQGTDWLTIPFLHGGALVTMQYRNLNAKEFRFKAGARVELWNADALTDTSLDNQPLIIAEGACDGLACVQVGYQRTVAVPGWSEKNYDPANYEPFKKHEAEIKRAKRIIVTQHNDNAGAAMLKAIANFFDDSDVAFVKWPDGCKDANDVLKRDGGKALSQCIAAAKSIDPPGGIISGFTDAPPIPVRKIWKLDWPEFDRLLAWRTREVSVGTGVPGAGKTSFATWCAHHLVRLHGVRVGMCMFETEATELQRHLFKLNGVNDRSDATKREQVLAHLDKHYRIVHRVEESNETHGMLWLKRVIHTLAARDGCRIIIIDPWNELEHILEKGENMTQYLNLALMKLRQWAEKYDVHICVLAHPKKVEGNRRLSGYDIADSAAWANKPGLGWSVNIESDDKYGEHVALLTWKVRSRQETGCKPGMLRMHWIEEDMTYRPIR